MKSSARIALYLCTLLYVLFCLSSPAKALSLFGRDNPPVQEDITLSTLAGSPFHFSPEDFSPDGSCARSYRIGTLPDTSVGVLQIDARLVQEGDTVSREELSSLVWYPLNRAVKEISFPVTPLQGNTEGEPAQVTLRFLSEVNEAPTVSPLSLTTYRRDAVSDYLAASDPEGDALRFAVITPPKCGTVSYDPQSGQFTYTPGSRAGTFFFTYLAIDALGNRSRPADVTITVERRAARITYADTGTGPLGYAASRLAQEGIFVGDTLNGQYYFHPRESLSRSEFLMLAMTAAGLEPSEPAPTGFADDSRIPDWVRPYVTAALDAGLMEGRMTASGQRCFCPDALVTPREAAAFLNRLLPLTDAAVTVFAPALPDSEGRQAVANLCSAGMMEQEIALSDTLSRGDGALILVRMMDWLRP